MLERLRHRTSQRLADQWLGERGGILCLEAESGLAQSAEERQWVWNSGEEVIPEDTAGLELCLFGMELPTSTFFVEGEALAEEVRAGEFGSPFVWREPRDWFAPLRRGAAALVADAQLFQERVHAGAARAQLVWAGTVSLIVWIGELPGRLLEAVLQAPSLLRSWFIHLPWDHLLSVRRGFLFGAFAGFSVFGSSIWAISSIPYLTGRPMDSGVVPAFNIPMVRGMVPNQLAWFFIQYPYISEKALIRAKNFHTYVITDPSRQRDYVVTLGQKFRRVEIYNKNAVEGQQVHIFTPGQKKTVWLKGPQVTSEHSVADGNLWMWKSPLWNDQHLKIYGLADRWLDSPYKRYSCAGFVHKFLSDSGIRVPILDAWDLAKQPWTRISVEEMEPGDIITIRAASAAHRRFWRHSITHVGVYIGHGKMIHAATSMRSPRAWVRIADMDDFKGRIDKVLRPPELL